ncbi:hypothetical protein [uncultured Methanobacterium sp.]|uniref:hypothetical protein n=1 Tax=uncultured Methanobacterium sp. TaxID=176306 RepID=UPI002AA85EAC|nr:hypothetical protein [uncultured Methanobacterium sp.]
MATQPNTKVSAVLTQLEKLDHHDQLTLVVDGRSYKLFFKGTEVGDNLTRTDLRNISKQSLQQNIVLQVDVSHLIFSQQVKQTDAYVKIIDDIALTFLHLLHKIKFQKHTPLTTTPPIAQEVDLNAQ